ncbi:hypothetical protein [Corynebacterium ulcerans]|nr:hypothetical protein [Corynebacterium ulcerans]
MLEHPRAAMIFGHYAAPWEEGLDAIPGAAETQMESKRKRIQKMSTVRRGIRGETLAGSVLR